MKNFKIIYLILRALEKGMDNISVDEDVISPESFGISEERFNKILLALEDEGYITGLIKINTLEMRDIRYDNMRITLKGLEYLENNAMMNKAFRTIKGTCELAYQENTMKNIHECMEKIDTLMCNNAVLVNPVSTRFSDNDIDYISEAIARGFQKSFSWRTD